MLQLREVSQNTLTATNEQDVGYTLTEVALATALPKASVLAMERHGELVRLDNKNYEKAQLQPYLDHMMIGKTIKLLPTAEQEQILWQHAGTSRFAYNYCKRVSEKYYKYTGKTLSQRAMQKLFRKLKKRQKYAWLQEMNAQVPKQSSKDFDRARRISFEKFGNGFHTNFKSRHSINQGFYVDATTMTVLTKSIKFQTLGVIKTTRQANRDTVYNVRIIHDGTGWYVSYSIRVKKPAKTGNSTEIIGIDTGIKILAVCSNGMIFANINKTRKIKKLEERKANFQRQMSKRYVKGAKRQSNNYYKAKNAHLKVCRKLRNIRNNHLHQATAHLAKTKPQAIVIESLKLAFMLKNKKLAKQTAGQKIGEFYRQLEYKCRYNSIEFLKAPQDYASSKLCSHCGYKYDKADYDNKPWSLRIRKWTCHNCKTAHDRDFNASVNLKNWYKQVA
ncbi:MAG: transposase [Turicibacter sp.]|nr:transposase [Turicibacter sp.]